MSSDICFSKSFTEWYYNPNKNWFKLIKCVLTLLRGILFIVFLSLSLYYRSKEILTNYEFKLNFPFLCLYTSIIYNWRFILSFLIVFLIILIKLFELISYCLCISLVTNRFTKKFKKFLKKIFRALHWSQLDWPCFLKLKYYLYIFDTIHYFIYLLSVIIIGCIDLVQLKSNSDLVIVFFFNILLFLIHIIIEIYRIVQSQRVESDIRDIFASDVNFSKKAIKMISEDQLGSRECVNISKCLITDTQHRAFSHPKDIFKINFVDVPFNRRGVNIVIGFHQTTIEAAKSILTSNFKPSKTGMLGSGIYFANNYDITDHKRNQSTEGGAIFCAKIDMGRVLEITNKFDDRNFSRSFNSKYLHHQGGEKFDEYVIYDHNQIIEYTIIVEMDAIQNFRKRTHKRYCNCLPCI